MSDVVKNSYVLVQIPTSLGVSCEVDAADLEQVRLWALSNLDTSSRWIVKLNGKNVGEAIQVDLWRCLDSNGKASKKTFNSLPDRNGWFKTKEEAEQDYILYKKIALERLEVAQEKLSVLQSEMGFKIDYVMEGDTYGIYEDYQYISVSESGYEYRLPI